MSAVGAYACGLGYLPGWRVIQLNEILHSLIFDWPGFCGRCFAGRSMVLRIGDLRDDVR
jgi:hypothetical protein